MGTPSPFPLSVHASAVSGPEVAGWLDAGATVVLPTETVYGLAVKPGLAATTERVFELKGRPKELQLPVIIGAPEQLREMGVDFNPAARALTKKLWPGPLTIVMGFAPDLERPEWLAGRVEVAVRLPGLELLRGIARAAGPLLVTSANGHGQGPKRVASEAAESLNGEADVVIDGGTLTPLASTIVNTNVSPPRIERLGAIGTAEIAEILEVPQPLSQRERGVKE